MAALYTNKIIREAGTEGAFAIENVLERWKTETIAKLKAQGYDGYGNKLPMDR